MNKLSETPIVDAPQWNMESIYPHINSDAYTKDRATLQKKIDELDSFLKTAETIKRTSSSNFDFPLWLSSYLTTRNETGVLAESLNAYAYAIYSTETTNTLYLNNLSEMEKVNIYLDQQEIKFSTILFENKNNLEDFYSKYPSFASYRYVLNQVIDQKSHQMTLQEEHLAQDLQRTGGNAWSRLHEQIISNLKDSETGKTFNELRNDAHSPDPYIRRTSWEKEITLLKQNEIALAASLNNIKGETITLNKRRHWNSALDRALYSSHLQKETLEVLIQSIKESLPLWRKYFHLKSSLLQTVHSTADCTIQQNSGKNFSNNTNGLSFYDLFAPIGNISSETSITSKLWTFEDAKQYIIKQYGLFSNDMGVFAKKAFDSSWIDAKIRPGKVGGAYCTDFPAQKESRILSNFTGSFNDVITLTHELGHAFHHNCIAQEDFALSRYPMTLAETASTFAETMVKKDCMAHAAGMDKIQIIDIDLQDVSQVLVDIYCRYLFEKSVFTQREQGELSAGDFCQLMSQAQEASYGNGLNSNRHEYMWAVKSHYYSTGLDFYNYPYAFGQLFAAGLYRLYEQDQDHFSDIYTTLLRNTGKMSCEDLCKQAGFDITREEFWKSSIAQYAAEIDEMEACMKTL